MRFLGRLWCVTPSSERLCEESSVERAPSFRRRGRWSAVVLLLAIAGAGYFGWREYGNRNRGQRSGAASAPAPIPLTVSAVRKGDFPVYLFCLGVVQPYGTVTVSSRVDDQVAKVDFVCPVQPAFPTNWSF